MRPVKRNRTLAPRRRRSADGESLSQLALNRGAVAAELEALRLETNAGLQPWRATPSGIVGLDYAHLLVEGVRHFDAVADGVFLYDPCCDEAVSIRKDGRREVVVTIGSLHVDEVLRARKDPRLKATSRMLADAVETAVNAYSDEGPKVVSNWLVQRVAEAAMVVMIASGLDGWSASLPRDPQVIWRELGNRWIVEPWGLGTHDEVLGGWA